MNTNTNTNTATPPAIHLFGDSVIRHVIKDGNPWFLAKDICECLGLSNVSLAIKGNEKTGNLSLDDDEADIINHYTRSGDGVIQSREMLFVNESGLYALIFKSRKAEARAFRKWVTSEVLPAIRRQGYYGRRTEQMLSFAKELTQLGLASKDVSILTRNAFPELTRRDERMEELEQHNAEAQADPDGQLFLSIMVPGIEYRVGDFYTTLPPGHRILAIRTAKGRATVIGGIMERLIRSGLVTRINAKYATYALASAKIIPITAN